MYLNPFGNPFFLLLYDPARLGKEGEGGREGRGEGGEITGCDGVNQQGE
jgi:hypothetical protein